MSDPDDRSARRKALINILRESTRSKSIYLLTDRLIRLIPLRAHAGRGSDAMDPSLSYTSCNSHALREEGCSCYQPDRVCH